MLLFTLDLGGQSAPSTNATAYGSFPLPAVTVTVMRPLWVTETPTDTIMVTPNPTPVGSFQ